MMCPHCMARDFEIEAQQCKCTGCGKISDIKSLICGGDFYVYQFVNDDWGGIPFYVGKGSKVRFRKMSGRGEHLTAICDNSKWHVEIVKHFDDEKLAYEYERNLKKQYKKSGFPIIDAETGELHKMNQRDGIERAKAAGKYHGGLPKHIPSQFYDDLPLILDGKLRKTAVARKYDVSRPTLDKWIKNSEYHTEVNN